MTNCCLIKWRIHDRLPSNDIWKISLVCWTSIFVLISWGHPWHLDICNKKVHFLAMCVLIYWPKLPQRHKSLQFQQPIYQSISTFLSVYIFLLCVYLWVHVRTSRSSPFPASILPFPSHFLPLPHTCSIPFTCIVVKVLMEIRKNILSHLTEVVMWLTLRGKSYAWRISLLHTGINSYNQV